MLRGVGLLAVGIGFLGVVLPLLPTTPFLLVASACFARSSPRLNEWLHEHDTFGPPLAAWEEHRALPRRAKWAAIALLWVSIPLSAYLSGNLVVTGVLAAVLVTATVLLARVPTLDTAEPAANEA
ncbi:hypothetical protein BRD56_11040 [Thermoplasmatales archaeon SW_10_69_26]|nr:MAG: hypothetical protein BRD56_11040 [Thermoplasmatales archaeon SW_10_69_26]